VVSRISPNFARCSSRRKGHSPPVLRGMISESRIGLHCHNVGAWTWQRVAKQRDAFGKQAQNRSDRQAVGVILALLFRRLGKLRIAEQWAATDYKRR